MSTDESPRFAMGLSLFLEKQNENSELCIYQFGVAEGPMGTVALHKDSGDIEIVDLPAAADGPNERHVLAQVVPQLQRYHDRAEYPRSDEWEG